MAEWKASREFPITFAFERAVERHIASIVALGSSFPESLLPVLFSNAALWSLTRSIAGY
jgi:hypothetical protein